MAISANANYLFALIIQAPMERLTGCLQGCGEPGVNHNRVKPVGDKEKQNKSIYVKISQVTFALMVLNVMCLVSARLMFLSTICCEFLSQILAVPCFHDYDLLSVPGCI